MNNGLANNKRISQLLLSTISNYFGRFIGLATWFLLVPFILNKLEPTLYGLWILVGSVVAYGSLLDFGIAGAVTKYIAEHRVKGQIEEARQLIGTALAYYAAIGILITAVSVAIAPLFPIFFNISPEHNTTARWLVILSGLGMGIAILSASTTAVFRGLQRFDLMNLLGIITTLLSAGATVVVLTLGGGVIGLVIVTILTNLLMQIPGVWLIYRIAPELRFGLTPPNRKMLRTVTSFSSYLFLIHVGGQLESKTDEIVIGAFLPVSAVTPYNLARKLSTIPQIITDQFLSLLLPLASALHAENDQARLRSLYITSTRLTVGSFLSVGISLVILAGPLLTIWVGEEFAMYSYLVIILTLASLIDIPTWPAGFVLQGISRHRFTAVVALCNGITNLVLSLVLVRQLGLTGVAIGTLIPTTIFSLGFVLPYAIRTIGVTYRDIYRHVLLPVFIPAMPAGIVTYLLRELFEPVTFIPTLLIAAVGSLLYTGVYLHMHSSEFEKKLAKDLIEKTFSYFRRIRIKSI
ncbi:MAG: oligosaccharide flippase family protein [Anaerolineaceae bacterium]